VEAFVSRDRCDRPETLERRLRGVLRIREVRRYMNAPIPEPHVKGVKPFPDAGLAGMNLLTSTDQADHDRPGLVRYEIKNSGSDRSKFASFFRRRMKSDVFACVHARCASSKMTT
jgi:hypothetical protein